MHVYVSNVIFYGNMKNKLLYTTVYCTCTYEHWLYM